MKNGLKNLRTFDFKPPAVNKCIEEGCESDGRIKGRCKKHDQKIRRDERRIRNEAIF